MSQIPVPPPTIVLASASPRRQELVRALGFVPEVRPAHLDEARKAGESPRAYVLRLAEDKARTASGGFVLAADTAVVLGDEVFGKPADATDARRMLAALAGRTHEVLTGVCVLGGGRAESAAVSTSVTFTPMPAAAIDWYVLSGEPMDKAGAYAIQGLGGIFVERIDGSYSNVVGLPLAETAALLRRAGAPLPWEPR
jgi:septum formation protein